MCVSGCVRVCAGLSEPLSRCARFGVGGAACQRMCVRVHMLQDRLDLPTKTGHWHWHTVSLISGPAAPPPLLLTWQPEAKTSSASSGPLDRLPSSSPLGDEEVRCRPLARLGTKGLIPKPETY